MDVQRTLSLFLACIAIAGCEGSSSRTSGRDEMVSAAPEPGQEGVFRVACRDGTQELRWTDFVRQGLVCLGNPRDLVGTDYELSARWAAAEGILPSSSPEAFRPEEALTGQALNGALARLALRALGSKYAAALPHVAQPEGPVSRAAITHALRGFIREAREARGLVADYPPSFLDFGFQIDDVVGIPEERDVHDMINYCATAMHLYDNAASRFEPRRTVTRQEAAEALHRFEGCLQSDLYPWLGKAPDFDATPDFDFPGIGAGNVFLPAAAQPPASPSPTTLSFVGERRGLPVTTDSMDTPRAAGLEKAPELLARIAYARDLANAPSTALASTLKVALALNPNSRRAEAKGRLVAWQPSATAFPQGKSYRVFALSGGLIEGRALSLKDDATVLRGLQNAGTWYDLTAKLATAGLDPAAPTWILFEDAAMGTGQRARYQAILKLGSAREAGHAPFSWASFAWGMERPLSGPRFSELPDTGESIHWNDLPEPVAGEDGNASFISTSPFLPEIQAEFLARDLAFSGEGEGILPERLSLTSSRALPVELVVYRVALEDEEGNAPQEPVRLSLFQGEVGPRHPVSLGLESAAALRLTSPTAPLHSLVFVLKTPGRNVVLSALPQYSYGDGGEGAAFPF